MPSLSLGSSPLPEKMSFDSALEALQCRTVLILGDGFETTRDVQEELQCVCGEGGRGPSFQMLSFADRGEVQSAFSGDVCGVVVVDLIESDGLGDRRNVVDLLRSMKSQKPECPFVYLRVGFARFDSVEQDGVFDSEHDLGKMVVSCKPNVRFQELLIEIAERCRL